MRFASGAASARMHLEISARRPLAAALLLAALSISTSSRADPDPHKAYFIAMRAPVVDPAPRYVSASPTPVDGKPTAIAGCDGGTYYLSLADGAAVRAAITNANTVQLQIANPGDDPSSSRAVCLIQAGN
jgi:hypothetical protein